MKSELLAFVVIEETEKMLLLGEGYCVSQLCNIKKGLSNLELLLFFWVSGDRRGRAGTLKNPLNFEV